MGDQFGRAEAIKLFKVREHQRQLRASDYNGLKEVLQDPSTMDDEVSVLRTDKMFILTSTRVGGEQYMSEQLYDFIAISNR